jgi:hypothetical protein
MEVNVPIDSTTLMSLKQKEHIELYSFEKGLGKVLIRDQRIDIEPIEITVKIKCPEHQKAEIKNKIINVGIQNCVYHFE